MLDKLIDDQSETRLTKLCVREAHGGRCGETCGEEGGIRKIGIPAKREISPRIHPSVQSHSWAGGG